jgi:hypothetical protein
VARAPSWRNPLNLGVTTNIMFMFLNGNTALLEHVVESVCRTERASGLKRYCCAASVRDRHKISLTKQR